MKLRSRGDAPHGTGEALWTELVRLGHLRPQDYDRDLQDQVRDVLGLRHGRSMARALRDAGTTAQRLVDVVLGAVAPFCGMLDELLALYARVGAVSASGDDLRVVYDFGNGKVLSASLAQFREYAVTSRRLVERRTVATWDVPRLWDLNAALVPDRARDEPDLGEWAQTYTRRQWPSDPPPPPRVGIPAADEALAVALDAASRFLARARARSVDRDDLSRAWSELRRGGDPSTDEDRELAQLALGDSDLLPVALVRSCHVAATALRATAVSDAAQAERDAEDLRARVTAIQAALPQTLQPIDVEVEVQQLLDVLALPVWGRRHEIYSAWVFTQIVGAVGLDRTVVHVIDGVLEFSFGGSHVATLSTEAGPVEVWAELRSAHRGSIGHGRTRGIQPDYRLTRPPVTNGSSAVLAVECKQYLRSARRNPGEALADYTGGLPHACVILAAYGPVSPSVLDLVPPERRARAEVVRQLRPGQPETIRHFQRLVRNALPRPAPVPAATPLLPAPAPAHSTPAPHVEVEVDGPMLIFGALHAVLHRATGRVEVCPGSPVVEGARYGRDAGLDGKQRLTLEAEQGRVDLWLKASPGPRPTVRIRRGTDVVTVQAPGPSAWAALPDRPTDRTGVVPVPPWSPGWWHVAALHPDGTLQVVNRTQRSDARSAIDLTTS